MAQAMGNEAMTRLPSLGRGERMPAGAPMDRDDLAEREAAAATPRSLRESQSPEIRVSAGRVKFQPTATRGFRLEFSE
jgi:hypothetical protein